MAFSIWASEYWGTGKPPTPVGTSNKMAASYQAVKAADGWLVMGATNQKLWALLCSLMERSDLAGDERFATNSKRLANREVLIAELEKTFALRTAAEWIDRMRAAGIPAGPLLGYPAAFDSAHGRTSAWRSSSRRHRPGCAARRRCSRSTPTRCSASSASTRPSATACAPKAPSPPDCAASVSASAGTVRLTIEGGVAAVVFDRPEAHNAMTWAMYEELATICEALAGDAAVRVVTLRGAGSDDFRRGVAAFVAKGRPEWTGR